MPSEETEETPQELLAKLKAERQFLSERMRQHPPDRDHNEFTALFLQVGQLDIEIKKIIESVVPEQGHGELGQFTLKSSEGPDPLRKRKIK
ncbi:hypothetical protein A2714_00240 [Candidatus Woesebacteria bacterium RIFCSPHIGHO2_01_FULL_38_9]|uniref:Uncharacterized protein n=2 Tax=Candidatus Woeseibacteriota TaxID=1752722 RepID=A0A1F7Y2J0_9BACT|nr:MAG: hypothetical protein A2714_00240 [Candidatus Woesebacteria bacterium RIFCSPHIGHO2_01_FULL_38_9]OGM58246.1 MAG: hypothetical protein A3A75_04375 [Candidatus Woesebacteria bacterium RIFCSPLOWO2_01_FULL_39_10]